MTRRQMVLVFLAAAGILLAVYWPALIGGKLMDDDILIADNARLRSFDGLAQMWSNPKAAPDFYPLTYTTWWLEMQVAGFQPWVLHLNNILLHAGSTMLLCLLLRRLDFSWPAALLGAALFSLHPVQVESVAWMAQRKNALSGVFYLLAANAFVLAITSRDGTDAAKRGALVLSLMWFALAMLSKPVTMTLAASIPLLLWIRRGRMTVRDAGLIFPYFMLAAPMALLTMWVQRTHVGASGPEFDLSLVERTLIAGRVFWFYLWKLVFPVDLMFAYPLWKDVTSFWWSWAAPAAAAGIMLAAWFLRRRITDGPWLALAHWVVTLSPALGFINIYWHLFYYVADHVQYLAMIGPCSLLAAGVGRLMLRPSSGPGPEQIPTKAPRSSPPPRRDERAGSAPEKSAKMREASSATRGTVPNRPREPAGAQSSWRNLRVLPTSIAIVVLGALAVRSATITWEYRDPITLWEATLMRNPDALVAYRSLSKLYCDRAEAQGDASIYQKALDIAMEGKKRGDPYAESFMNISAALAGLGRHEEAVDAARTALQMREIASPAHKTFNPARAHYNIGTSLMNLGRTDEAVVELETAVRLDPTFAQAWYNLGNIHLRAKRWDAAITAYEAALNAKPLLSVARVNMGSALQGRGDVDKARAAWEEALRLTPTGEAAEVAKRRLAALAAQSPGN